MTAKLRDSGTVTVNLEAATSSHSLDVLHESTDPARIIRLFTRWRKTARSLNECADLLARTLSQATLDANSSILIAPGGFVAHCLSEPTQNRYPSDEEFSLIRRTASDVAVELSSRLPAKRPTVVFGVDIVARSLRSKECRRVGQFAAVLPRSSSSPALFPKRYPTTTEEAYLRVLDPVIEPAVPVVDDLSGRLAVLVCHDISAYHPRGRAKTSNETREAWRASLCGQFKEHTPTLGVNLVHYVESVASFRQQYHAWANEVAVPLFGVSELASDEDVGFATELADSLTSNPAGWPVLDLLEPMG